jgi:mono/diheme cytochrome c family protein
MWSSPQFRTEPVPASAFRFLPGTEIEAWSKARAGRELIAAAHCMKCHAPRNGLPRDAAPELLATAPDFQNAGNRLEPGWVEAWVKSPQGSCPTVAPERAADIAAYLATLKEESPAAGPAKAAISSDAKTINAGAILVEKLHLAFWIEPLRASRKHTDAGLIELLLKPALHHPDTTFPDVRLSREEALAIAAYIRAKQPRATEASTGNVGAGKATVASSCVACHDPKNATRSAPIFEEMARADWTVKGCLAPLENRGRAPNLRLAPEQVAALIAFRNADRDVGMASLRRFAPAEYAARQIKALNCAQCHVGPGGENKVPDITFAGEKFERAWLEDLFAGKHGKIRGWQEARMPAFASRATNLALGLAAKHGAPTYGEVPLTNPELVAVGAKLAGTEGYSCVACHDAGAQKALQVFEGQGPNLRLAGERLRYDYFQRWMHFPQRVAPATIMPRYTKDRDHALLDAHLEGNAEKQFEAVWQWMRSLNPTKTP